MLAEYADEVYNGIYDFSSEGLIMKVKMKRFAALWLCFVLLLMAYIFSYGAQLQQLSDETL